MAEQLQPIVKQFSVPTLESIILEIVKTDVTNSEGNVVEDRVDVGLKYYYFEFFRLKYIRWNFLFFTYSHFII